MPALKAAAGSSSNLSETAVGLVKSARGTPSDVRIAARILGFRSLPDNAMFFE